MELHEEKDRFIILDFDGVVTSCLETPGSYITNRDESYGASPSCLNRLIELADSTGAKIVVSSNWRRFDDTGRCSFWNSSAHGTHANPLPALRKALGPRDLCDLPKERHIKKSEALRRWFAEKQIDPSTAEYVIFDDDESEGFGQSEFGDRFILTDYRTGVTAADCEKAKEILRA